MFQSNLDLFVFVTVLIVMICPSHFLLFLFFLLFLLFFLFFLFFHLFFSPLYSKHKFGLIRFARHVPGGFNRHVF